MTIENKNVVILGATGVIGKALVGELVSQGATVVAVSRSIEKANELVKTYGDRVKPVQADFKTEQQSKEALTAINNAIITTKGGSTSTSSYDHIYSILGFVDVKNSPTESTVEELKESLESGLYNTFNAAKYLLPGLKTRPNSSYTILSGGFANFIPAPQFWRAGVKNAALNNLTLGLASEFKDTDVVVNSATLYYGVVPAGGLKNQLGFPSSDVARFAKVLSKFVGTRKNGEIFHFKDEEQADTVEF